MTSRKPLSRVALAGFIFGGGAVLWIIGQGPAAVSAAAQAQAQRTAPPPKMNAASATRDNGLREVIRGVLRLR